MFAYSFALAVGAMTALGIEHRGAIYHWYLGLRTSPAPAL